MTDSLYLLVEADPILSICRDWRNRWMAARKAAWDFASSLGSPGIFSSLDDNCTALVLVTPIPDGWCLAKRRRVTHQPRMVPLNGTAGDEARAAMAALPTHPHWDEIAKAIGCPSCIVNRC